MLIPEVARAAKLLGGVKTLCERLSLTRSALHQWQKVPRGRALEIEDITGGAIMRHEMRPDLWSAPSSEQDAAS